MELEGKVKEIFGIASGVGKSGKPWKSLLFTVEYEEGSSKSDAPVRKSTVCFKILGDHCENHGMRNGDEIAVSYNPVSKNYNGNWFTENLVYKIEFFEN